MDEPKLHPATVEEIEGTLSHALRFNGARRFHRADGFMAEITAEHLRKQLELSGFVLMKKPPRPPGTTPSIRTNPGQPADHPPPDQPSCTVP